MAKKNIRYLVKNAAKVDILNKGLKHKSFKALIDVFLKKRFFRWNKRGLIKIISKA